MARFLVFIGILLASGLGLFAMAQKPNDQITLTKTMKENLRLFAEQPMFQADADYTGYGEPERLIGAQNEIKNLVLDVLKKDQFPKSWFFDRCESAW